jgi:CDP-glycerol glycerophosphotransferase (TagB/SpsB family)
MIGLLLLFLKNSSIFLTKVALNVLQVIIPKNKSLWLFGTRNGYFNDNTKYLFLKAGAILPGITHIWICPNSRVKLRLQKDYPKAKFYSKKSLKGIWLSLRAKVYIYNSYASDVAYFIRPFNVVLVNLWHGIPLKKIECDVMSGPSRIVYHPQTWKDYLKKIIYCIITPAKPTILLSPSPYLEPLFAKAFRIDNTKVISAMYPRLLPLLEEKGQHRFLLPSEHEILEYFKSFHKIFIYMPTWRDAKKNFLHEALPDLVKLNDILLNNKDLLIVKMHVNSASSTLLNGYSNIVVFDNNEDIYPFLPFTDALIADYSSILFDYMLMKDKKVILYPFDKKEYIENSREFYFAYDDITFSSPVYTFDSLLSTLDAVSRNTYREDEENRNLIIRKFWGEVYKSSPEVLLKRITTTL